jgi:hypothetical protein
VLDIPWQLAPGKVSLLRERGNYNNLYQAINAQVKKKLVSTFPVVFSNTFSFCNFESMFRRKDCVLPDYCVVNRL